MESFYIKKTFQRLCRGLQTGTKNVWAQLLLLRYNWSFFFNFEKSFFAFLNDTEKAINVIDTEEQF